MGYSIAKEKAESAPTLNIQADFNLAKKALERFETEFSNFPNNKVNKGLDSQKKVAQKMKDLGIERCHEIPTDAAFWHYYIILCSWHVALH